MVIFIDFPIWSNEPMVTFCQLGPEELKFWLEYKPFFQEQTFQNVIFKMLATLS